jgi:hypothetical protein
MIEVEGKINDQPIAILIDSRSSHSYLDTKMVGNISISKKQAWKTLVGVVSYMRKKEN